MDISNQPRWQHHCLLAMHVLISDPVRTLEYTSAQLFSQSLIESDGAVQSELVAHVSFQLMQD